METVNILCRHELTVLDDSVHVDNDNPQVIVEDNGMPQERSARVRRHAGRVYRKDAVPSRFHGALEWD